MEGRSVRVGFSFYEILRERPARAHISVLAYVTEQGIWKRQADEQPWLRPIPSDLTITKAQYERLADCCKKEEVLVSGKVDAEGTFLMGSIHSDLDAAAKGVIREAVAKWEFKPARQDGRSVEQELTLLLRIALPHPSLPREVQFIQDRAIMPIVIEAGTVSAGPYSSTSFQPVRVEPVRVP